MPYNEAAVLSACDDAAMTAGTCAADVTAGTVTGDALNTYGAAIVRAGQGIQKQAGMWQPPPPIPPEPPVDPRVVVNAHDQATLVAAMNDAGRTGTPTLVKFTGTGGNLEVGLNRPGTKVGVDVPEGKRLDVIVRGGEMVRLLTGDRYLGGRSDHDVPPIKRLEFQDMVFDLTAASTYPILTGINSAAGVFGFKRIQIETVGGVSSKVLTAIRGNAAAAYEVEDIDCPGGTNEYVVYLNYGPGVSWVRRVRGQNNGRGIVQCVYRTTENYFAGKWASAADQLWVEEITARDNGGKDGSNAVSIAGWGGGEIHVSQLDVVTHWNAGGLAIVEDAKQHDVTGSQGNWTIVGPGFMLPIGGALWAHNRVTADLAGSTIINGNDNPGQAHQSSRPQVEIASVYALAYSPGTYGGEGPGPSIHNIGQQVAVPTGEIGLVP